jgi:hypothetical protein
MTGIIFKGMTGQNPFIDIPRLQILANYGMINIATVESLSDFDNNKYRVTVINPPELTDYAKFLAADDENKMPFSMAEGLTQGKILTDEEAVNTVLLFRIILNKKIEIKFDEKYKVAGFDTVFFESQTWQLQKTEAEMFKADSSAALTLLPILSAERGISIELLANKILAKAQEYTLFIAQLLGSMGVLKDKVKAASSLKDLRLVEAQIEAA